MAILGAAVVTESSSAFSASPGRAVIAKKCKKKRSASSAKKRCKKRKSTPPPTVTPPAPAALPLTTDEVVDRINQKALEYCNADPDCIGYGYERDSGPGDPLCSDKSTYSWTCEGYTLESGTFNPPFARCDFSEVVERDGYDGITSHLDTSFGGGSWDPGWSCS